MKFGVIARVSVELLKHTSSLEAVEKKLDKLLESFLDEVIDQETYQLKKNQLLQGKLHLKSQIEKLKANGSNRLGRMGDFINESANADKITRAKNNCDELALIAKKVGSNYLIDQSRVLFSARKPAHLLSSRSAGARKNPHFSFVSSVYILIRTWFKNNI